MFITVLDKENKLESTEMVYVWQNTFYNDIIPGDKNSMNNE